MSPFRTPNFLALQAEQYAKLKASGFEDIELSACKLAGADSLLRRSRRSRIEIEAIHGYYRRARQYTWEGNFEKTETLESWRLHAEGKSVRQIARVLGLSKSGVHRVVAAHRETAGLSRTHTGVLQASL